MQFSYLCFFISQIVFIPTFLLTTKKLFKPDMKFRAYLGYLLISPFCVYLYSIIIYGVISVFVPSQSIFNTLMSYADIFALLLSFLFAFIYERTLGKRNRAMAFFIYICFYMVGMVFSLIYDSNWACIVFSIIIPIITSLLMYRYITVPLASISDSSIRFHTSMLFLPITAEAMLVLRFIINIVSLQDKYLGKYDNMLMIYSTIFGYVILVYLFLCTSVVTKDIDQLNTITNQQEKLIRENERIQKFTLDTLKALVGTIEAKDLYTNGHSQRVADYSRMIAQRLGYNEEETSKIYQVALLHDIGKIAIPDDIINKPGKLTDEEYGIIKEHPVSGAAILQKIEEVPDLYFGALYHHERWDGRGYPFGLIGDEIPDIARIISVADAYDAMTSKRSYRPALSQEITREEIYKGIGTQFYPDAARAMLCIIDEDVSFRLKQQN